MFRKSKGRRGRIQKQEKERELTYGLHEKKSRTECKKLEYIIGSNFKKKEFRKVLTNRRSFDILSPVVARAAASDP